MYGIILDNQPHSVCIRRGEFQTRCECGDCDECEGNVLDLTNLWSENVAPMLVHQFLDQLPKRDDLKVRSDANFGHVYPEDIDWDLLMEKGYYNCHF